MAQECVLRAANENFNYSPVPVCRVNARQFRGHFEGFSDQNSVLNGDHKNDPETLVGLPFFIGRRNTL